MPVSRESARRQGVGRGARTLDAARLPGPAEPGVPAVRVPAPVSVPVRPPPPREGAWTLPPFSQMADSVRKGREAGPRPELCAGEEERSGEAQQGQAGPLPAAPVPAAAAAASRIPGERKHGALRTVFAFTLNLIFLLFS